MSGTIKHAVLVLGAAGDIGRGIVGAALARGHAVVAADRDAGRLEALRRQYRSLPVRCLPGAIDGDGDGAALAARIRELDRPLTGIVASLGGPSEGGRLLDRPAAFLRHHLDRDLLPHLAAARQLLPVLAEGRRGGSYVLVGGPGGDYPWAGYGHRSVAAAALQMLARVLHDEARALQLRVQLLAIDSPVCTDAGRVRECPDWPSALAVGQRAMAMVERCDGDPARAVVHYRTGAGEYRGNHERSSPPGPPTARALLDSLAAPPSSPPSHSVDAGLAPYLPKGLQP